MQDSGAVTVCCDQKRRSAVKLWLRFWMFRFALLFGDKRIASSLLGPFLWNGCDWWSCGAKWSVWTWSLSEMVSAPAVCSPDVPESGGVPWHGHIYTQFWHIYLTFVAEATLLSESYMTDISWRSTVTRAWSLPWSLGHFQLWFPHTLCTQKLTGSISNFLGCQTVTESQASSRWNNSSVVHPAVIETGRTDGKSF